MNSQSDKVHALLKDFPVTVTTRVRWGEMDAFGHMNNTFFLRLFEDARIAYFEEMDIMQDKEVGPILGYTDCRFKAPIHYPDTVTVGASVAEVGEDRFVMKHVLVSHAQERVAGEGTGRVVGFDYQAGTKATLPEAWREAIARIEN